MKWCVMSLSIVISIQANYPALSVHYKQPQPLQSLFNKMQHPVGGQLDPIWRGVQDDVHSKSGSSFADINIVHDLVVSGVWSRASQTCPGGGMEGDSEAHSAGESAV